MLQVGSRVVTSHVIPWQDQTHFSKFAHANFIIMIKMSCFNALCNKNYVQIVLLK